MFELLRANQLYAKLSKCNFGQSQIEYLGYIISGKGVSTSDSKIEVMLNWARPNSVKVVHEFLGLTDYYHKFIKHFPLIRRPLNNLLKEWSFVWNEEATKAFETLQQEMTQTSILVLPYFSKSFVVEVDACGSGVGVVLM